MNYWYSDNGVRVAGVNWSCMSLQFSNLRTAEIMIGVACLTFRGRNYFFNFSTSCI